MNFEELGLSPNLLLRIKRLGFEKPTMIQEKSIPLIISGRDVIGESATGSGKTLAFGCGIIDVAKEGAGVQALVLTPTRELAEQVKESIHDLSKTLKIAAIYGGVAINPQISALKHAEVVVATPGRLLDHLERRTIDLSNVKILVMDEADRMFDMGFIDDVEHIIRQCPKKRQTLFFSATISTNLIALAKRHMKEFEKISAEKMVDPSKLKQVYYDVPHNMKISLLLHLLDNETSGLVMVFCNTRRTTDFVVKNLKINKFDAIAIHGGLSQNKRTRTIDSFNKGKVGVLVCTDVAARGLDIDNVSHVYNYDLPADPTDYVHRIGRTARAGESGKVINLLAHIDHDNFGKILHENRSFSIVKSDLPKLKPVKTIRPSERKSRFGGRSGRHSGRYRGSNRSAGRHSGGYRSGRQNNNSKRSKRYGSYERTGNSFSS